MYVCMYVCMHACMYIIHCIYEDHTRLIQGSEVGIASNSKSHHGGAEGPAFNSERIIL